MANTITKTTILDGARHLVVNVNVSGDGSGDETGTIIVDRSTFAPTTGLETVVEQVFGMLSGFKATILADATTDLVLCQLPDGQPVNYDWRDYGGISSNKAGTGFTGDILLTTSGLGSGELGTFTLVMRKGP
jgi:hypothetical protein